MKKLLSVLVGLYLSLTSFAQTITPIAWSGNHLNPFEQTVLLDSTWSGVASVKAYTTPGGRLISTLLQPTVTRSGNALFIRFANTANMSNSTYVTITTGTIVRRAGYLSLGYSTGVSTPGGTDSGGVGVGIINTDMVQGLPLLLAKKVDVDTQTARDQGQDNQLSGFGSALTQTNQNLDTANQKLANKNDFIKKASFLQAKAAITVGTPASFRIANNEVFNCPTSNPCPTNSTYDGTDWYHSPALLINN